jgi:hypothetical protein
VSVEAMMMCLPSDDFQPRWDQWFAPDVCQDCGTSDFIEGTLHSCIPVALVSLLGRG